jgi:hypothetical protein
MKRGCSVGCRNTLKKLINHAGYIEMLKHCIEYRKKNTVIEINTFKN